MQLGVFVNGVFEQSWCFCKNRYINLHSTLAANYGEPFPVEAQDKGEYSMCVYWPSSSWHIKLENIKI